MKRSLTGMLIVVATIVFVTAAVTVTVAAQKRGGRNGKSASANGKDDGQMELAPDPKLQKLQRTFVIDAATLAKEYERKKDLEGARACYEQILRVVPNHPEAKKALEGIHTAEMTKESKSLIVKATEGWQDAGINLIKDRPLTIRADGSWTFAIKQELSADGMEVPKELKEFNWGALVGIIRSSGDAEESKPFVIGKETEITPEKAGRLYLRMYDYDPTDNKGQLRVELQGTFEKGK